MDNKKKLFIGKIPFSATSDDLRTKFAEAGSVVSADIIFDRDSGRSKGFGFVEYDNEEDAQKAIAMFDGKDWDGQVLVVNVARPKTENSGGGYGGGRNDNRGGGRNDFRGGRGGGRY